MIKIKINDQEYGCPNSWEDITMQKYLDYLKVTAPTKLRDLVSGEGVTLTKKDLYECYQYMAKVVEIFCGVPYEIGIKQLQVTELQKLWVYIEKALQTDYQYQYKTAESGDKPSFRFKGDTYYLPTKLLAEETAGELIMAQLLQDGCKQLEQGNYIALAKVTAVLCRKKGEWYEDYDIEQRAQTFLELPMDILLHVGFFLQKLLRLYTNDLAIYTAALTLNKLKRASKTFRNPSEVI